jgi:hypothetical protein
VSVKVEIWLRGDNHATTVELDGIEPDASLWTDDDVRAVLEGMLRTMDREKRPGEAERPISLRGLSWIVNPYDEGGVLIAIEITLGAAVAGPFDIEKAALDEMIRRVLSRPMPPGSSAIH